MQHNPPVEADSRSAGQEIPRILYNPKVHYRTDESTTGSYTEMIPAYVYTLGHDFLSIYFSIVLPSTPRSSNWSLPFGFSSKSFERISHTHMHATCCAHLTLD
jgi:hypothetical protein